MARRLVLFALALLALPAQASAVTIGQTAGSRNEACGTPNFSSAQFATGAGTASYTVPAGHGVITSWSHAPRFIPGAQLALRVYRKVTTGDPPTLTVVGTSAFEPVPQGPPGGDILSFPTNIPVAPGDVIGIITAANAAASPPSCFENSGAGDVIRETATQLADGQSGPFTFVGNNVRLNVAAVVQPSPATPTSPTVPAAPPAAPKDTTKPTLSKIKTAVDKNGVSVTATPNENCTFEASGSVSLTSKASSSAKKKRVTRIKLLTQKKAAKAGIATKLVLKVRKKDKALLRKALRRGSRKATIRIKATDTAGNVATKTTSRTITK